jgi:hypothetical protein
VASLEGQLDAVAEEDDLSGPMDNTAALPDVDAPVARSIAETDAKDAKDATETSSTSFDGSARAPLAVTGPKATPFLTRLASSCSVVAQRSIRGDYAPVPVTGYNPAFPAMATPVLAGLELIKRGVPVPIGKSRPCATLAVQLPLGCDRHGRPIAMPDAAVSMSSAHAQLSLLNQQYALTLARAAAYTEEQNRDNDRTTQRKMWGVLGQFDPQQYSGDPVMATNELSKVVYANRTRHVATARPPMPYRQVTPRFAPLQKVDMWQNLSGAGIPTSQWSPSESQPAAKRPKLDNTAISSDAYVRISDDAGIYGVQYSATHSMYRKGHLPGVQTNVASK